jgi:hypothetical protein
MRWDCRVQRHSAKVGRSGRFTVIDPLDRKLNACEHSLFNLPLSRSKVHGMRCTRKRIVETLSALSSAQSAGSVDIGAYIVA